MSDWISVKDRLPELDQTVMVCYPSGYDNGPIYAFGARVDDVDGWLWGVQGGYSSGLRPDKDASWNSVEADDDYPVQFWRELPSPPTLERTPQASVEVRHD